MNLAEERRVLVAVRSALRTFGDGLTAAAWLGCANSFFNGAAPFGMAQRGDHGLDRVLAALAQIASAKRN